MTLSRVVKTMETATAKTAGDGAVDSWLPYHPDTKEILHGNVLTCGAKYRGRRALRIIISQSGVTTFSLLRHDYQLTPAQCAHVPTNLQTRQYRCFSKSIANAEYRVQ